MLKNLANRYYKSRSDALSKQSDKYINKYKQEENTSFGKLSRIAQRAINPKKEKRMYEMLIKSERLTDRSKYMQSKINR
jgi:metal-responsive CopG/Arc/MetJ family transcriptional regulator